VAAPPPNRKPQTAHHAPTGRRPFARGALGLAAAGVLAACAAPQRPAPRVQSRPPADPSGPLAQLQEGHDPIVAGEALDGTRLRRFYARRGYAPAWDGHADAAEALRALVLRADAHGLDPDRFGAPLLHRLSQFPALHRDVLLTHAVLSYGEALAFGAVPARRRRDGEALVPEPVDVPARLEAALHGPDPAGTIETLAPDTASYQGLRRALREERSRAPADRAAAERQRLLEVNLERQRWLPRRLPADRVWVNIPDQRLVLFRGDRPVFATRVVVGAEADPKQSPEFQAMIGGAFLNPPWVIPADIFRAAILPRAQADPGYLARRNIALREDGDAEQAAGPDSALGAILFDMPNRFDVYLHDTPDRALFARDNRRASNGCIRVENPLELAARLWDVPLAAIEAQVAEGETRRKPLPRPVPVFLVYHTAFVSPERGFETRPDFYGRDAGVQERLQARGAAG
jgi:murein L,D-transpeptidase YcbB/YkuD